MDDLDFIKDANSDDGDATLYVRLPNGSSTKIEGLHFDIIQNSCPVLAYAFEWSMCSLRHDIEDVTLEAVASVLRYAYTLRYMPELLDEPVSLLIHLQVYHLAKSYDIPELRLQAQGRIVWECEMSCSLPMPPIDLLDGIKYLYKYLSTETGIIDTITNYCVACTITHDLGNSPDFLQLTFQTPGFHRDLCRVNMLRGFADDSAQVIVRLPVSIDSDKGPRAVEADEILGDYLYEMWNEPPSPQQKGLDHTPQAPLSLPPESQSHFYPTLRTRGPADGPSCLPDPPEELAPLSETSPVTPQSSQPVLVDPSFSPHSPPKRLLPSLPSPSLPSRPQKRVCKQSCYPPHDWQEEISTILAVERLQDDSQEDSDGYDIVLTPSSSSENEEDDFFIVPLPRE